MTGATGSGVGDLILERLCVDYRKKCIANYSMFPNQNLDICNTVSHYNTLMSLSYAIDYSNLTFCFDNPGLSQICQNTYNIPRNQCDFKYFNQIFALQMSSITHNMRFNNRNILNNNYNNMTTNLIAFPRLQFLISSVSPLPIIFKSNLPKFKYKTHDKR